MRPQLFAFLSLAVITLLSAFASGSPPQIELSVYCNNSQAADHTECISAWIDAGRQAPDRTLRGSPGAYFYRDPIVPYSGMHLECAGADQTTFRNIGGASKGIFLKAASPVNDVRIEKCGFDVNGSTVDFLAIIDISPDDAAPSSNIRVRKNRMYDSAIPGGMSAAQRQYILLINCNNCQVEENHLTEGGRIKVGRPGRQITIRKNIVEHANDNAITVADIDNGISENITVEDNRIVAPKAIGVFFGADGDLQVSPSLTARNVRVENNRIEGDWSTACILGRLPANSTKIRVLTNTCVKTGPAANYSAGIVIKRTDGPHEPASNIRVERNVVSGVAASGTASLDYGGVFFTGRHTDVRITRNEIRNVGARAIFLRDTLTDARILQNILTGGTLQIAGLVQGQVQPYTLVGSGSVVARAPPNAGSGGVIGASEPGFSEIAALR